jgi:hypothetical protein
MIKNKKERRMDNFKKTMEILKEYFNGKGFESRKNLAVNSINVQIHEMVNNHFIENVHPSVSI